MLVRIARIGAGTPSDTLRVPLPNYRMVAEDLVNGNHVVEVPDDDLPPGISIAAATLTNLPGVGQAVTAMPAALLNQWTRFLESKYGRAPGTYNPVVR